jgi:hypothetical protein
VSQARGSGKPLGPSVRGRRSPPGQELARPRHVRADLRDERVHTVEALLAAQAVLETEP